MCPQTHYFPEFVLIFQAYYQLDQIAIMAPNGEILFTITSQTIN